MMKTDLYNLIAEIDEPLKHNPDTQRKLHILGYDNPDFVERKLKDIKRK